MAEWFQAVWVTENSDFNESTSPAITATDGVFGTDTYWGGFMGLLDYIAAESLMAARPLDVPVAASTATGSSVIDPPFPPIWPYPTGLVYGREFFSMDLSMVRRDTLLFDVQVLDDGTAVNLSPYTITMRAKWSYTDSDANAVFALTEDDGITVTDPANGKMQCRIAPEKTSSLPLYEVQLVYDIQISDGVDVFTVVRGTLTVRPDVA